MATIRGPGLERKFHRLADMPKGSECRALGVTDPLRGILYLRGVLTGEFRIPRKGEWYLSGAMPEAYRASTDKMESPYYILRLVRVESWMTTTERIVQE